MAGVQVWGSRGGTDVANFLSNFLLFKIERREVVEYAAAIFFQPPTWGDPPWYAQEGSDTVRISEIFGLTKKNLFLTQKKVKILFFQNRLLKRILRVLDLSYHSTTFFSSDSPPNRIGKASKTAQIWVKISQFAHTNRAITPKKKIAFA